MQIDLGADGGQTGFLRQVHSDPVIVRLVAVFVDPQDLPDLSILVAVLHHNQVHAAISIHRVASEDYRPYFDLIEPIFWKHGGRPHWGKVHSLGAEQLQKLYPGFAEFNAIRKRLDPGGRMLNDHLRKLFGAT